MKYLKPELKIEIIQPKQHIAAGVEEWLSGEGLIDVGITPFFVTDSE